MDKERKEEGQIERELEGKQVPEQERIDWACRVLQSIRDNLNKVVFGKEEQIEAILNAFCAKGHILLEDHPGVGKTLLARAFGKAVGLDTSRIQFTPDVVPGGVTGTMVYSRREERFTFRAGPVFTNILLADEINRGTPRTQSSLLQAMEEQAVTVEDAHYELPYPFFVIATQNPLEVHGTFPLPESQLDRFMMLLSLGYPDTRAEDEILRTYASPGDPLEEVEVVLSPEEVGQLAELSAGVYVGEKVRAYILDLVNEIREDSRIKMGVSPRAALGLARAAQGRALMKGRDSVLPDDVKCLAVNVLAHRVVPVSYSDSSGEILREHLDRVPVPEA